MQATSNVMDGDNARLGQYGTRIPQIVKGSDRLFDSFARAGRQKSPKIRFYAWRLPSTLQTEIENSDKNVL